MEPLTYLHVILSIALRELCNECHTSDDYEKNNGIVPGSLLYNWQGQQAAFLKDTIGVKQVIGISASPHLL